MRQIAVLLFALLATGCDPGYLKRIPVFPPEDASSLEEVLDSFDARALERDLFRSIPPRNHAELYREDGYEVIRWYDRDPDLDPATARGSFFYVAVLARAHSRDYAIAVGAFPSFGEPPDLKRTRRELIRTLCANEFEIEGGCPE